MFDFIKKHFSIIVIVILAVIIVYLKGCSDVNVFHDNNTVTVDGKKYEVVKRVTDTVTVPVTQTVYRDGKTIYKDSAIYVPIYTKIDTAAILKNYYAIEVYKDTLTLDDSLGMITVVDTITQNQLQSRIWKTKINKTIVYDSTYLKEISNEYYVGGLLNIQKPNSMAIGASVCVKTKVNKLINVGVGINSNLQPFVQGAVLWNISFKKKK